MGDEIRVQTVVQAALMIHLKGQISDGLWENSKPHEHWKRICEAEVIVDPSAPGMNFYHVRKYAFTKLLEYVESDLLAQAQVYSAFPDLLSAGRDFSNIPVAGEQVKAWNGTEMIVRKTFIQEDIDRIMAVKYDRSDLVHDLKTLSDIVAKRPIRIAVRELKRVVEKEYGSERVSMESINAKLKDLGINRRVDGYNRKIFIVDDDGTKVLTKLHRWKELSLTAWVEAVTSDMTTASIDAERRA